MTINEAIRLKELGKDEMLQTNPNLLLEADRLSIEALKYIDKARHQRVPNLLTYLPGETEEAEEIEP